MVKFNIGDLFYSDLNHIGIVTGIYSEFDQIFVFSKWLNERVYEDNELYVLDMIKRKIWKHYPIKKKFNAK